MADIRVRDLFNVPDHVGKETFVLKLAEGVTRADETAKTYVVTPPIVQAIDGCLQVVRDALRDGRSRSTYIHGSFGSGKSHFMAIVSLLLDANEAAWRITDLHPLREKHKDWLGKKLLQLRFHMVGEESLEAAIFRTYVRWVRETHPKAQVPALFADQELFADAERLLEHIGDKAFFAPMNPERDEAWGEMNDENAWTRERFREASQSGEPKARGELFDALVKTHFQAYARQSNRFIGLDEGLGVLAAHAKLLGYDAVVLFLDEIVLWLAAGASNQQWMHTEVQKVAKLVEAQDMARAIPIVGYLARQRDLAEMVGEEYAGAENKRLRESLSWFNERFGRVDLSDQNLPAIVEKRVLDPKDDAARRALDEGFTKLQREAKGSWSTLQASEDGASFRKLYPFTPALIETLVALSSSLQKSRTALKLLTEILVDHIPDLKLGDVVPVGDLWDLIGSGDDSTDGVMRARVESAKQLYRNQLLPLIHQTNETGTPERCQRLRPDHRVSLGCSGCPLTACRNDNRVVKTLLLAALLPQVATLRDLTASRVVALNHGTIRTPIPGMEAANIAQRLRNWASSNGAIRVGKQADPTVSVEITEFDLNSIIGQARDADKPGVRQQIVRNVLFEALELERTADWGVDHTLTWRGSARTGHVRFGNVRRLGAEQLRCPENHDWRLIIDYPFDDPGFGPNDDLEIVDKVREEGNGTWTLVWLPSFFSDATNALVGEIAILEHILSSKESVREYTRHLRAEDQLNAQSALQSMLSQKKARLEGAIQQAYGLARESEHDIDPTRSLPMHVHVLKPGVRFTPSLTGGPLSIGLHEYVPRLLEARYPRHPDFPRKISRQVSERVIELFGKIMDTEERKILVEREDFEKLKATLGCLGIVRVTESAAHLHEDRFTEIDRKRQQKSIDHPSVAEVRHWIDENRSMGLQWEAADLVVRAFARWSARALVRSGRTFEAAFNSEIPGDVVLEKPVLPSSAEWIKALDLAGHAFGVTLAGRALHADNLKRFEAELNTKLAGAAQSVTKLPTALTSRLGIFGLNATCDRVRTANSAAALVAQLQGKTGVEQVRTLASFAPETSPIAVGKSVGSARANVEALDNRLVFGIFQQVVALRARPEAASLIEQAARVLRCDELQEVLAARLRVLAESAQDLLQPRIETHLEHEESREGPTNTAVQHVPIVVAPHLANESSHGATKATFRKVLEAAARDFEGTLAALPSDSAVEIIFRVRKEKP